MTKEQEITCIICPIGCKIIVQSDGTTAEAITGHRCKQGIIYAQTEALDPRRMLTSSILVHNGTWPLVSVKTIKSIPKEKIFSALKEIQKTVVDAPIKRGDVLIHNVAHLYIDIVATKTISIKKK
ncbi:MAG: DUF1667 domain-containing protein [Candidatus Thermoplasmatota archaeon]|nr:DUF1667 domain-containing protein [Candidatus Thermoplasmatota archaeon]MBU1940717.1 DUF1667 domain-containing protein [Candidatus Thermoplasmatota archaeon]